MFPIILSLFQKKNKNIPNLYLQYKNAHKQANKWQKNNVCNMLSILTIKCITNNIGKEFTV